MSMLSIEECRKILDDPDLTDEDIRRIRDSLYSWLHRFLDQFFPVE